MKTPVSTFSGLINGPPKPRPASPRASTANATNATLHTNGGSGKLAPNRHTATDIQ